MFAARVALDALLAQLKETWDPTAVSTRECVAPALRAASRLEEWIASKEAVSPAGSPINSPPTKGDWSPGISPRTAACARIVEAEITTPQAQSALQELVGRSV